jgi:hypothetical protein
MNTARRLIGMRRGDRAATILALNPLGYWKLQEGAGSTANDSSGNGLHGTISGAAWEAQVGTDGTPALYFDGVNDVMIVAETAILQPDSVSVSLWARAEAGAGAAVTMDDGSWSYAYGSFHFPNFQVQNGGSVAVSGEMAADVWQHWLWTYTAMTGVLKAYRDGVEIDEAIGSATNISYSGGLQLRIGVRLGHSYFRGALQHVAVFREALGAGEAAALAR